MEEIAPFDFDAAMSAADNAAAPAAGAADQAVASQSDLTPVRCFTKAGIEQVEELLKAIRSDKTLHKEDVEALLEDPMYAKELAGCFKVDRTRVFATKLELCDYFIPLFGKDFLEQNRKNAGLWTWLALAYYSQFVKTKKDIVTLATDARWVYEPENYRFARRHFVAGTLYLYLDIGDAGVDVRDMFFSGAINELSRFVDVLTYLPDCVRNPAFLLAAAKMYYAPTLKAKVKRGAFNKGNAWSVWQYLRVFQQLKETHDFFDKSDAGELLAVLPSEFDCLKIAQR